MIKNDGIRLEFSFKLQHIFFSFLAPVNCESGKFYGDNCDDKVYYSCWNGVAYRYDCAHGTEWDASIKNCNWVKR